MATQPILSIPPFPGARSPSFAATAREHRVVEDSAVLLAALNRNRVGGCYWGRQRHLSERDVLLDGTTNPKLGATAWHPEDDPWALLDAAADVRLPAGDGRALLALAARLPLTLVDRHGREVVVGTAAAEDLLFKHLTGWRWTNPFDGTTLTPFEAIEMCGFWRRLIDSNRQI
jgi:capsular polysaccharide export protein